jgi:hypothetical protein
MKLRIAINALSGALASTMLLIAVAHAQDASCEAKALIRKLSGVEKERFIANCKAAARNRADVQTGVQTSQPWNRPWDRR